MAVWSVALVSLKTAINLPQRSWRKTRVSPHRLMSSNKTLPRKSPPTAETASKAVVAYSRDGKLEAKRDVQCETVSFDILPEPCHVYDINGEACLRDLVSITD